MNRFLHISKTVSVLYLAYQNLHVNDTDNLHVNDTDKST
jgi:hypothetical protein